MDRQAYSLQKALEYIGSFQEMPKHRVLKYTSLYHYASIAKRNIVELGTYRGAGALALWFGAQSGNRAQVHTVDAYTERTGWAGEHYGDKDREACSLNIDSVMQMSNLDICISRHYGDISQVGKVWKNIVPDPQIGLLFWDCGTAESALREHLSIWTPYITIGGFVIVHDTKDGTFNASKILSEYSINGKFLSPFEIPEDMFVIVRA